MLQLHFSRLTLGRFDVLLLFALISLFIVSVETRMLKLNAKPHLSVLLPRVLSCREHRSASETSAWFDLLFSPVSASAQWHCSPCKPAASSSSVFIPAFTPPPYESPPQPRPSNPSLERQRKGNGDLIAQHSSCVHILFRLRNCPSNSVEIKWFIN